MPTQYFQYPNGKSSGMGYFTEPWGKTGTDSQTTIQYVSASEGTRFTSSNTAAGTLGVSISFGPGANQPSMATSMPNGKKWGLSGIQLKINNDTTRITNIIFRLVDGGTTYSVSVPYAYNTRWPKGTWVTIPNLIIDKATTYAQFRIDVFIYCSNLSDFNVKGINCYQTFEIPAGGSLGADDANFTFTTREADLGVDFNYNYFTDHVPYVMWNFDDGSSDTVGFTEQAAATKFTHTFPYAGTYNVKLTARNFKRPYAENSLGGPVENNNIYSKTIQVTVPSGPYEAKFDLQTSYYTVVVDGAPSVGKQIDEYRWDWGDGSAFSYGPQAEHTYASAGTWPIKLRITNNLGEISTLEKSVKLVSTTPPPLSFTTDRELLKVAFYPSILTGTYSWNFGDGTTSTAKSPTKTYPTPGTYSVTLQHTSTTGVVQTATKTILVQSAYEPIENFADALRLELESKPNAGDTRNYIENSDGELGGYEFVTPMATSKMSGSNTLNGADDKNIEGWKLIYTSENGGVQKFGTELKRLPPAGGWIAGTIVVPYLDGWYRVAFEFYDANRAYINNSRTAYTPFYQASDQAISTVAFQVPSGAIYALMLIEQYGSASTTGGLPVQHNVMLMRNVMWTVGSTQESVTNLAYSSGANWVNAMGDSFKIRVSRKALNLGVLNAEIRGSSYDPAKYDTIRPGQKVRLRVATADSSGQQIYETVYSGEVVSGLATYDRPTLTKAAGSDRYTAKDEPEKTVVRITAADRIRNMGVVQPVGVAEIYELPYVLENKSIPFLVNGSSAQVSQTPQIVSYNQNAKLIDQIAITRDSNLGYAFINRNNVLEARDPESMDPNPVGIIDEDDYSDIDVSTDTDKCINSVTIKFLKITGSGTDAKTEEISYGPYEDAASIAEWGYHPKEFTIHGLVQNAVNMQAYATTILNKMKTPKTIVSSLTMPIVNDNDIAQKAFRDLYDLVEVRYAASNLNDLMRVTGITHTIELDKWNVDWEFEWDGAIAMPQNVPSPPVSVSAGSLANELRPIGEVTMFYGPANEVPAGWLVCDGSSFNASTYPLLFEHLGVTTLPNMQDRMPIGVSSTKAWGGIGGSSTKVQTAAQMPSHTHTGTTNSDSHSHTTASGTNSGSYAGMQRSGGSAGGAVSTSSDSHTHTFTTGSAGSGSAMDIMPPWMGFYFIIRAQ